MSKETNLIWIDLEMTGLNPGQDQIIEIATIMTDSQLNILAEGPVFAIHQPDEVMATMDDWNTQQHRYSGLTARVKNSSTSLAEAEQKTLVFLQKYVLAKYSPMCGNSICQDRRFMARLMPTLEAFFHYRNLDVSTVKELANRWAPDIAAAVKKNTEHLALADVYDSINELKHYKESLFKLS